MRNLKIFLLCPQRYSSAALEVIDTLGHTLLEIIESSTQVIKNHADEIILNLFSGIQKEIRCQLPVPLVNLIQTERNIIWHSDGKIIFLTPYTKPLDVSSLIKDILLQLSRADGISDLITQYNTVVNRELLTQALKKEVKKNLKKQKKLEVVYKKLNSTMVDYKSNKSIKELFEEVVHKFPKNGALEQNYRKLTYEELNVLANNFADYIQQQLPENNQKFIMPVIIDNKFDSLIVFLSLLKLGHAFVPLSPEFPKERLLKIIKKCNTPLLIGHENHYELLENFSLDSKIITIQDIYNNLSIKEYKSTNPSVIVDPESIAYVLFTSGSTGEPKGVIIRNKSVNRLIINNNYVDILSTDVFSLNVNLIFDGSIFEIWGAWLNGAKLICFEYKEIIDLDSFIHKVQELKISIAFFTSAYYTQIINYNPDAFKFFRCLIIGGELINPKVIQHHFLQNNNQDFKLIHAYGPTECTVFSTCLRIENKDLNQLSLPIGAPIANTSVFILNENNQLCDYGEKGRLFIGGPGVALGYLGDSKKTSESFISNPLTGDVKDIIYDSGDYASLSSEGVINFHGRLDGQVKIRGYRIEIAEVEKNCLLHPAMDACIILVLEEKEAKKLVLFCQIKNPELTINELRNFLKNHLPFYMIPEEMIFVEKMPLNSVGKIDTNILLEIRSSHSVSNLNSANVSLENKLRRVWANILHIDIEDIHDEDNFFSLGGNSLTMMLLLNELSTKLMIRLKIRTFMNKPTILGILKEFSTQQGNENIELLSLYVDKYLPLTTLQQQMVFYESVFKNKNYSYNVPVVYLLNGKINRVTLQQALQKTIQAHDALRLSLIENESGLSQVVQDKVDIPIQEIITSTDNLDNIINKLIHTPFSLQTPGLIRVYYIKADNEEILIFLMHHFIVDYISFNNFLTEISKYYNNPHKMPDTSITQFANYVMYMTQFKRTNIYELRRKYWLKRLQKLGKSVLPVDHMRPDIFNPNHGKIHHFMVTETVLKYFNNLVISEQLPLSFIYLMLFKIFIFKCSTLSDVVVGLPAVLRENTAHENLIGCTLNVIPSRSQIDSNKNLIQILHDEFSDYCTDFENANFEFSEIFSDLSVKRDLKMSPLFNLLFVFHHATRSDKVDFNGISVKELKYDFNVARFDLTLNVVIDQKNIEFYFDYNTDLFLEKTVYSFSEAFVTLLESVAHTPLEPIAKKIIQPNALNAKKKSKSFDLVTHQPNGLLPDDSVQSSLVRHFPYGKKKKYPYENYIKSFLNTVREYPTKIAVSDEVTSLSYKELNAYVNYLCMLFKEFGLQKGDIACVMMERNHHYLIVMLAIMKLGLIYLPVVLEKQNYTSILKQAEVKVIITDKHLEEKYGVKHVIEITQHYKKHDLEPEAVAINDEDIAYIIFTSGTTGTPKGVPIHYAGFINHVAIKIDDLQITSQDILLQNASQSFDISIWQFLAPLLVGGQVVIFPERLVIQPKPTLDFLIHYGITLYETVPSLLKYFLESCDRLSNEDKRNCLRMLIVTGEGCPVWIIRKWLHEMGAMTIVNAYGPTECSDDVTHFILEKSAVIDDSYHYLSIGKPLPNLNCYILDKNFQSLPIGSVGDLYISGVGVAKGYLKQPEQTNNAFLPNPCQDGYSILYKTGDVAKWDQFGNIHHLGRLDDQVKIRGIRIELGEIDTAIRKHSSITNAAIVPYKKNDEVVLLCFFKAEISLTASEIKEHLGIYLSADKIPSYLIQVNDLPTSIAGKIDKKTLIKWFEQDYKQQLKEDTLPEDTIEQRLRLIWDSVLPGSVNLRSDDDFFTLGGYSLLAVKLLENISCEFKINLPINWVFIYPTLAKQINAIHEFDKEKIYTPIIIFKKLDPRKKNIFFIHPGGGSAIIYKGLADELATYANIYGVESYHLYHKDNQYDTIEKLAAYYKEELLKHQLTGSFYLAGWSLGGIIAYELAKQLKDAGIKVAAIFMLDTFLPDQKNREMILSFDKLALTILEENGFFMKMPSYYKDNVANAIQLQTQACIKYMPIVTDVKIIMFKTTKEEELIIKNNEAAASFKRLIANIKADPSNGWGPFAPHMEIHLFPGNHESLVKEERKNVAQIIGSFF